MIRKIGFLCALLLCSGVPRSFALLLPDRIHPAEKKKTKSYRKSGLVIGGNPTVKEVVIQDIRFAANPEFERIVIDLTGNDNGNDSEIQSPPFYQFGLASSTQELVGTLWGQPKLNFNANKVIQAFKKSTLIQKIIFFPRWGEDRWSFVLELKLEVSIEIFELSQPARVIIDLLKKKPETNDG